MDSGASDVDGRAVHVDCCPCDMDGRAGYMDGGASDPNSETISPNSETSYTDSLSTSIHTRSTGGPRPGIAAGPNCCSNRAGPGAPTSGHAYSIAHQQSGSPNADE